MGISVETVQDTLVFDTIFLRSEIPADYLQRAIPVVHDGIPYAENFLRADWITVVLILSLLMYAIVATFSKHIFTDMVKLLTLGTAGRPEEEYHGLFRWQSTISNLASFVNIALFLYLALTFYMTLPVADYGGLPAFLLLLTAISLLVAVRHIISVATGLISERRDVFSEYLNNIYILYRVAGIALFPLIIAICYVPGLPAGALVISGVTVMALVVMFRIFRLLAIFLQHGVSIFYFLLYLCALEILPVAVLYRVIAA